MKMVDKTLRLLMFLIFGMFVLSSCGGTVGKLQDWSYSKAQDHAARPEDKDLSCSEILAQKTVEEDILDLYFPRKGKVKAPWSLSTWKKAGPARAPMPLSGLIERPYGPFSFLARIERLGKVYEEKKCDLTPAQVSDARESVRGPIRDWHRKLIWKSDWKSWLDSDDKEAKIVVYYRQTIANFSCNQLLENIQTEEDLPDEMFFSSLPGTAFIGGLTGALLGSGAGALAVWEGAYNASAVGFTYREVALLLALEENNCPMSKPQE